MTTSEAIDTIKARFADVRCAQVEQIINIMANPLRFHILCALSQRPFTVSELVDICDANISNLSQQLKMMWMAGHLAKERQGKQIVYRLGDERIAKLIASFESLYAPDRAGAPAPAAP